MPPESTSSKAHAVQVRYLAPSAVKDEALLARMSDWLDKAEHNRLGRLINPEHRHAFLVSHALVRRMLADKIGCEPQEIRFGVIGRDKPVIAAPQSPAPVHFNLTHTHGLVAVAIGSAPLGIDAEWLGRQTDGADLAKRYFTASEVNDVLNQPDQSQQSRFLTYWTLKEAFLKAQGWGIVDSLHGFEFELSPSEHTASGTATPRRIRLRIRDARLTPTHPWRFHHWVLQPEHLMSLAVSARLDPSATDIAPQPWTNANWNY